MNAITPSASLAFIGGAAIYRNISVIAYGAGVTYFQYRDTSISPYVMLSPGFFNSLSDVLKIRDIIYCHCAGAVALRWVKDISADGTVLLSEMM